MAVTKIGIDFNALGNLTTPNITIPRTVEGFIETIPETANEVTGGYLGLIIMTILAIFLVLMLLDRTSYGWFRYSTIRGFGIGTGMTGTMGLLMINIGYYTNYYHVVIFLALSMIATIWVYIEER